MNILIYNSIDEISKASSILITSEVIANPKAVLGLATGSTALIPYKGMIAEYNSGIVNFEKVSSFNLDEYCNLDVNDKNSYHSFMYDNLFDHININKANTNFLNGNADDIEAECKEYEKRIDSLGGVDIQLLGIGSDGHIAFNEPAEGFAKGCHKVALQESTIKDNSRFFNSIDEVPTHALTMGIGTIMKAKKILIIATGENKAKAVYEMINGEITPKCPASVLKLHNNCTVMLDKDAAKLL